MKMQRMLIVVILVLVVFIFVCCMIVVLSGGILLVAQSNAGGGENQLLPGSTSNPPVLNRPNPITNGTLFADPSGLYSLSFPKDWKEKKSGSEQQFCTDLSSVACVATSIQIKANDPTEAAMSGADFFKKKFQNYRQISGEKLKLAGQPAYWIEQSYTENGVPQRGFLTVIVFNRIGFELLGWAPENDYQTLQPIFKSIVNSFFITSSALPYEKWKTFKSKNFSFFATPGTWAAGELKKIADQHENALLNIQENLEIKLTKPLNFYLYPGEDALFQSTARRSGFAINEADEVHSIWTSENDHQTPGHELTHVLSFQTWGNPSEALLGEGLAVCMDNSGRDYQQEGRTLKDGNQLIPLSDMLGDAWFNVDSGVAYPQSGSFVCFLLERFGVKVLKDLYQQPDFSNKVEKISGSNFQDLENEWLTWLDL